MGVKIYKLVFLNLYFYTKMYIIRGMRRDIEKLLLNWKDHPLRMPLLIRGARQVGKSYIIETFGKQHFKNLVTINFELEPAFKQAFQTLQPTDIIQYLNLSLENKIIPGNSLLFLDEIQECPNAISSLRYFKENMPTLHIIAAGSLLEFALNNAQIKIPVGRIQFLYMKPLSFLEFLTVLEKEELRSYLEKEITVQNPPPAFIHEQLLQLLHLYQCTGGMPSVILAYVLTHEIAEAQKMMTHLLNTYRNDFGKYAASNQHELMELLFNQAPQMVAQIFKYVKISPDIPARDIRAALHKLYKTDLLHPIYSTAPQLPLKSHINEKKFKLLYLDTGLLHRVLNIPIKQLWKHDIDLINQGQLTEQFVGQELLAYTAMEEEPELFFWHREQKNSQAEVDYLHPFYNKILPIEVKSSHIGRLRSLNMFLEERGTPLGIRISTQPLQLNHKILSVPFYAIACLNRFLEDAL